MEYFVRVLCVLSLVLIHTVADIDTRSKGRGKGSMWWGIAKAGEPNNLSPLSPGVLFMDGTFHGTLRRKQRRLARENPGVLVAVAKGANQAIHECSYQVRSFRWNCSTRNFLRGKNLFGKIVDRACPETAFIYAITSAAVTYAIARACSEGSIETCNCDYTHKGRAGGGGAGGANGLNGAATVTAGGSTSNGARDWEWGGCSDNINFGLRFSREFVDTGERGRSLREKMNLHNNEAGRMHVHSQMRQECKCHGMSGSCTVKTCWMRLPPFRIIGDQLKDRFDAAIRVLASNSGGGGGGGHHHNGGSARNLNTAASRNLNHHPAKHHKLSGGNTGLVNTGSGTSNAISTNSIHSKRDNRGTTSGSSSANNEGRANNQKRHKYGFQLKPYNPDHKTPEVKDLVYLEPSPGFCDRNVKLGIQGTQGRQCNITSELLDGCEFLCCGRGQVAEEVVVVERCNCTFHWCCEVKCEVCRTKKTIYTCL